MKSILTIIGARPQIIKAAALSRAIRNSFPEKIQETIVHTGQHYDKNMSQVFFDEMGIPAPDINLEVGSESHGKQTADMIEKLESVLLVKKPDFVVLYGDTNSTLAGSVAASKLNIPIIHIEAGLRSFNKSMPEEINRIVCDHTATLLFSPTKTGVRNLVNEGFRKENRPPYSSDNPGIFHCGDIMYDNSLYFSSMAEKKSGILEKNNLVTNNYVLATIHRNNNTDIPQRLNNIFNAFQLISIKHSLDIYIPLHPRTAKVMEKNLDPALLKNLKGNKHIKLAPPASFFDIIVLEKNCNMVMTDSGGVQKEAYFFEKPVIILRPETEWVEIVEQGTGMITDANTEKIIDSFEFFSGTGVMDYPPIFGDGRAAEFICRKIVSG